MKKTPQTLMYSCLLFRCRSEDVGYFFLLRGMPVRFRLRVGPSPYRHQFLSRRRLAGPVTCEWPGRLLSIRRLRNALGNVLHDHRSDFHRRWCPFRSVCDVHGGSYRDSEEQGVSVFICHPCIEKDDTCEIKTNHLMSSYGRCEACGKPALCVDCKCHKFKPRKGN